MAIIDLTINNPALKRTEVVEADADTTATEKPPTENASTEATESAAKSGSRLRRAVGITGALALGVVGFLTFRKLRGRPKTSQTDKDTAE